jgi:hypothetical protein
MAMGFGALAIPRLWGLTYLLPLLDGSRRSSDLWAHHDGRRDRRPAAPALRRPD